MEEINSFKVNEKYTENNSNEIESIINKLGKINNVKLNIITLLNVKEEIKRASKNVIEAKIKLNKFEEDNKFCPWCGNSFTEGGHLHE